MTNVFSHLVTNFSFSTSDSNSFAYHLAIHLWNNSILKNRGATICPTNNNLLIIYNEDKFLDNHIFNQF